MDYAIYGDRTQTALRVTLTIERTHQATRRAGRDHFQRKYPARRRSVNDPMFELTDQPASGTLLVTVNACNEAGQGVSSETSTIELGPPTP